MRHGNTTPLVSIVTPSYNQAAYIAATIESVATQDYADFEHIIVDAGSTDGTLEILARYPSLRWVSEPDEGQSDAINKGFAMARGDILGWLNSDDIYFPGALAKAVRALTASPPAGLVYCNYLEIDTEGNERVRANAGSFDLDRLLNKTNYILQPTAFFRREVVERVGGLDPSYHYAMDYDFWIRIAKAAEIRYVDDYWAAARMHGSTKTSSLRIDFWPEIRIISRKHGGRFFSPMFFRHWTAVAFGQKSVVAYDLLTARRFGTIASKIGANVRRVLRSGPR